jgi:chromate transporter
MLWFGPLVGVSLIFGNSSVYFQEGVFFSKAAVVTFGGAYSVLAYIAQQAVERYGWLRPGEMLDGLGMAETTPGPLIMVVQFVGFIGAYRDPGPFSPLIGGIVGSILTTWVTFVPCFLWVFLGAPYMERLRGNKQLNSALSAITAAVVGVVLNLAIWFSLHTLFGNVTTTNVMGLRLQVPEFATADTAACAIAILACLLTFYLKKGLAVTLSVSAAAGVVLYLIRSFSLA